jgi:uncharacterized protein DUF4214
MLRTVRDDQALTRIGDSGALAVLREVEGFVTMENFGYLRRDPDRDGFQFWLSKLNQFNGDFTKAEMVRAFISSTDYRNRFQTN